MSYTPTPEDVDKVKALNSSIAEIPVLGAVAEVLRDSPSRGYSEAESIVLLEQLKALQKETNTAWQSIEFDETDYKLALTLTVCAADHQLDIDIPHEKYGPPVLTRVQLMKVAARGYWTQFATTHMDYYRALCSYRPDVDFSQLHIDASTSTTLYFDPKCPRRVGVFGFYVGPNGDIKYKKK